MTLTKSQPTRLVDIVPHRERRRGPAVSPALLAAALTAVAIGIRSVGLIHSFELWVDEMLYADLGASAGRGEMPRLADGTFFLHPPGFFLLEGGIIRLFGIPTADSMHLAFDLRWLTATLGALTVGLVFLLIRRVAGTSLGIWSALVLALEPFVLRINSRVILESLAELMLVAGLLIVVRHLQEHPEAGGRGRDGHSSPSHEAERLAEDGEDTTVRLFAGGLLLGYAVFTKDAFAMFAVVPMMLAVIWRRTLAFADAAVVIAGAVVPYGVYLVVVDATGHLGELRRAKLAGVLRLSGAAHPTGFNAPHAPSLLGRLGAQAEHYGTSYVILLLCPLAGLVAACSARPERRLLGLIALAPGVYGVYMVLFGAAEEQYAYPMIIAGVIVLAVVVRMMLDHGSTLRLATIPLLVVFLIAELILGTAQELTRDDGLLTFRGWAAQHLPPSVKVGVTNDASGYAFKDDPRFGPWPAPSPLELSGAQYVLTFDVPTRQGYTPVLTPAASTQRRAVQHATPEFLDWLKVHATPLFRAYGPTYGETVLWYIGRQELARAAAQHVGEPPGIPAGPGAASGGGK